MTLVTTACSSPVPFLVVQHELIAALGDKAVFASQTRQPVQNAQANDFALQNHSTKTVKKHGKKGNADTQDLGHCWKKGEAHSEVDINTPYEPSTSWNNSHRERKEGENKSKK